METIFNSSEKFNELIFENKNKVYGAYALRKNYKDNLSIALLFTASFFGFLVFLAMYFGKGIEKLPDIFTGNDPISLTKTTEIIIPQPEIKKPKVEIVKPPEAPKTTSGQMLASDDKKDVNEKTNEQQLISDKPNDKGKDSAATTDTFIPEVKKDDEKEIVSFPDKFPDFDNLPRYIKDNVVYPEIAKEGGVEGVVYISFIVETDGTVSDVKAMNMIGGGCEKEAIRVVKAMKKWKPGVFKGKARRVPATLPIKFKLN